MTTTIASATGPTKTTPLVTPRVCFSFAAYAKAVVAHLRASGVPIAPGLSHDEFAAVESAYGFEFPPDIRSVLREGLPVGPGFPNWRSASRQQLRLLLGLPAAAILREVSAGDFWPTSWAPRPENPSSSSDAREFLRRAPTLVPIYRQFYIPASPCLAGNPVFYVRGGDVKLAGLDLADFFRRERPRGWAAGAPVPAWAATSARRVDFWTDLAEEAAWRERERICSPWEARVEQLLQEARQRLKEAGWAEEEVAEMIAPASDAPAVGDSPCSEIRGEGGVLRHVKLLSLALLRGGWSAGEVVESMGWTTKRAAAVEAGHKSISASKRPESKWLFSELKK
ncbi:uncharacterized protein LOC121978709 [Zingiber officinale]|uniref:Knr4/Smi1-like domain-containing protein n=1 Tax=Zingiber officinale TaxID=94328 RepID=A0A8J5GYF5_ZINOF|nr:uncharacterized protein LOC121978709 [Zingiber officinale]KAG6512586.1 hypothetical protein ZIOFF_030711 [Zingiber officinale]